MTLNLISTTAPDLTSGAFSTVFGEYETVSYAQVMFDNPETTDYIFKAVVTISGHTVTTTVKKTQVSSATPTWGAAVTGDFTAKTFVVLADCT